MFGLYYTVQSCPWVESTHGLGWVETFKGFSMGWVGSWVGTISKNSQARCRLYYVCSLYQTVRFVNLQFGASLVQLYIHIMTVVYY